mmetsp:Transcript_35955/g.71550  ORF Transcript_35955/g.71550 Transcript_35955/m.71550 type:complete len:84 (+) Transcript_35955:83-334(+)
MTREEALHAAESEGLELKLTKIGGSTPYSNVYKMSNGRLPRSFLAKVNHFGKRMTLGCFKTAEEAALEVARASQAAVLPERRP